MTNQKQVIGLVAVVVSVALQLFCCNEVATSGEPPYYEPVEPGEPKLIECDVAVYGGTPAGVTADGVWIDRAGLDSSVYNPCPSLRV